MTKRKVRFLDEDEPLDYLDEDKPIRPLRHPNLGYNNLLLNPHLMEAIYEKGNHISKAQRKLLMIVVPGAMAGTFCVWHTART